MLFRAQFTMNGNLQCLSPYVGTERRSGPAFVIKAPVVLNNLSEGTGLPRSVVFEIHAHCYRHVFTQ